MTQKNIFYLANNRIVHTRLQNMFQEWAHITSAMNFTEALQCLQSRPEIDCFFVEYHLESKNGLFFVNHLRTLPEYDAVPVILMVPVINQLTAYHAMRCGVNETISKMISQTNLRALTEKHINTPHQQLVKRPYYEIECAAWQMEDRFFQFCPELNLTIQANSPEDASEKMKATITDLITSGKKTDFHFIEMDKDLHRIIPPRE